MSTSDYTQGICVFVGLEKGVEKTSIYEVIQKMKEAVSPVVDGNILTSSYVCQPSFIYLLFSAYQLVYGNLLIISANHQTSQFMSILFYRPIRSSSQLVYAYLTQPTSVV